MIDKKISILATTKLMIAKNKCQCYEQASESLLKRNKEISMLREIKMNNC